MESHERQPDVSVPQRTLLDRLATRLSHLSGPVRVGMHILVVLIITATEVALFRQVFGEDTVIRAQFSTVTVLQSLLIFYGLSYWALPNLFYKRRYGALTLAVVVAFWLTYVVNRVVIFTVEPTSFQAVHYVKRIRDLVGPTGWLGCFTSLRVFLWNFALVWVSLIIPLALKLSKEMIVFRQRQFELKRKRLLLDRDNAMLKLNFLKAQISPHFLFNTLNSIYSRVVGTDDQAADLVLRLAELMRYNLYEANAAQVPLAQEMAYLRNYVQLEQARHGERLFVSMTTPPAETPYGIAPLLLNAFVENAFKHGIKSGAENAYVLVDARLTDNVLHFVVENSLSQGPTVTTNRRSGGVGLPNVQKRLDLLYPNGYLLTREVTDESYRVELQIWLRTIAQPMNTLATAAV